MSDSLDISLTCRSCVQSSAADAVRFRCECGGLFDLPQPSMPPRQLVAAGDEQTWSMWRYRQWLPVGLATYADRVSMGEGATPIVSGGGSDTWLKLEFVAPTGSFKDRGAAVLVAAASALGARSLVADSSGNAGTSVAAYAARVGLPCTVFVPGTTSDKKIRQMTAHGATVIAHGTRADAAAAATEQVSTGGGFYASHVYSPFFFEGTQTYLLEILEQTGRVPDRLVLPMGNGTLVLGVARAAEQLLAAGLIAERPQLVLVQADACAPVAEAVRSGRAVRPLPAPADTIAEGIAIASPPRGQQLLEIAQHPGTIVVTVADDEIASARQWLGRRGLYVEPTAAAAVAGHWQVQRSVAGEADLMTVIPLTGSGLKVQ